MEREELLTAIAAALAAVTDPHFYEDERGFQGAFYAELYRRLGDMAVPDGAILREEYQKRLGEHGLTIRPDIILHEPFNPARHQSRANGNHAVIELKRRASRGAADEAFGNLTKMIDVLNYPLGVFINVDATRTWEEGITEKNRARIVCIAISLGDDGKPRVIRA